MITYFSFKENIVDQCMYHKINVSKFILLLLYVYDILLASNDIGLLHETKRFLSNNFEMKDLGNASYVGYTDSSRSFLWYSWLITKGIY